MAQESGMTYKGSGVDYDSMDPFKLLAQGLAAGTSRNAQRLGVEPIEWTRGESVYVTQMGDRFIGHVEEGLGTKNLVGDAVLELHRTMRAANMPDYGTLSQDTIAMIVNDMITLSLFPACIAMHLAVGDSEWFTDEERARNLLEGWKRGSDLSRCIWGGGETPTLKDIIIPETVVLSGSAWGVNLPGKPIANPHNISDGDAIVFLTSSGPHANGLTLCRKIAELPSVPDGYNTKLSDGSTYGESLLVPTHIYVGFIEDCIRAGVDIHYGVNITGHGWRKLMRANGNFSYEIDRIPELHPVFKFIQEMSGNADEEMYGNFNMGAGFAVYVAQDQVAAMQKIMESGNYPFGMMQAGFVVASETKKVVIRPKDLTFEAKTLAVR